MNQATGPDLIPTKILKLCAGCLAFPMWLLACTILAFGAWPKSWKEHWITPLYKKKAVSVAGNYRGVHLTAQLSKAAERVICRMVVPYVERTLRYGPAQFAYTKGRGGRDALLYMAMRWLFAFDSRRRVGLYCSDVAGAFDRVSSTRLAQKLRAHGLHPEIVAADALDLECAACEIPADHDERQTSRIVNVPSRK